MCGRFLVVRSLNGVFIEVDLRHSVEECLKAATKKTVKS
jgi:hypothetical protein